LANTVSATIIEEREDDTLRQRLVEVDVESLPEAFKALLVAPLDVDRWLCIAAGEEAETDDGIHPGLCDRLARLVGVPYAQFAGETAAAVATWHMNTLLHLPPGLVERLMASPPGTIPTADRISAAPWN
jgi:hypothetical protein